MTISHISLWLVSMMGILSLGAVSPGVSIQNHNLTADAVGFICSGETSNEEKQDQSFIVEGAPSGLAKTDDRQPGLSKKSIDDRLIFSFPKARNAIANSKR